MIVLNKGNSEDKIVLTLFEKQTLANPDYNFIFDDFNGNTITFQISSEDDLSDYPKRYNEFRINTVDLFDGKPCGFYQYKVVENGTNVVLEVGKLDLKPATNFEFTTYESTTIFKGYGG